MEPVDPNPSKDFTDAVLDLIKAAFDVTVTLSIYKHSGKTPEAFGLLENRVLALHKALAPLDEVIRVTRMPLDDEMGSR